MAEDKAPKKIRLEERSLQDLLSLGYIYLLILGLVKDSIYYGFMGVNYLNYSTIFDVLLSPISYILESYFVPLILVGISILLVLLGKYQERSGKQKKLPEPPPKDAVDVSPLTSYIFIISIFFLSFFIGTGIGGGYQYYKKLKNKSAIANHHIYFNHAKEEAVPVRLAGQNSQYLFFIKEGGDRVSIVPIGNTIFKIEEIPEAERKEDPE
ncbi:MAG: hypothetical protein AAF798_02190 [Bacteroidota bacterium]